MTSPRRIALIGTAWLSAFWGSRYYEYVAAVLPRVRMLETRTITMNDINKPASPARSSKHWDYAEWALVLVVSAMTIVMPLTGRPVTQIALILTVPFACIHGIRRYGWKVFVKFFVVSFIVSNVFENISILTGFPFGNYYYTGGPKLFAVPIFIGPIYFGLGYVSWLIAATILDRADEYLDLRSRIGKINAFVLPVLAGAIMTMFDVGSDSSASTIGRGWIWKDGGGLFGVPFTNYLGWWFVTYAFFQIFSLMLARQQSHNVPSIVKPANLLPPIVIYLSLALSSVSFFISKIGDTGTVADATGTVWSVTALLETMMIINIFSSVVVSFIAVAKIARGDMKLDVR